MGMPNKLLSTISLAVIATAALGFEQNADAAIEFEDTVVTPESGTAYGAAGCVTEAWIGHRTEQNPYATPYPQTGDSDWIHIVAKTNCVSDTVALEFRLPPGVVQFPNASVQCWRGRVNFAGSPLSAYPSTEGACYQQPLQNTAYNTLRFAWSKIRSGEFVEIQVPVTYTRRLSSGEQLYGLANGAFAPINLFQTMSVPYRATLTNQTATSSYDGTSMTFQFKLDHFHEVGQVFVDYGTTQSFGSTLGPINTDAQYTFYNTFQMSTPTNWYGAGPLQSGTTYYWRPRIVTPFGTFYGTTQTATTYYQLQQPSSPPTYCRRGGC